MAPCAHPPRRRRRRAPGSGGWRSRSRSWNLKVPVRVTVAVVRAHTGRILSPSRCRCRRVTHTGSFFLKAVSLIALRREGPYWPEGRHRAREKFNHTGSPGPGCLHARASARLPVAARWGRRLPGRVRIHRIFVHFEDDGARARAGISSSGDSESRSELGDSGPGRRGPRAASSVGRLAAGVARGKQPARLVPCVCRPVLNVRAVFFRGCCLRRPGSLQGHWHGVASTAQGATPSGKGTYTAAGTAAATELFTPAHVCEALRHSQLAPCSFQYFQYTTGFLN